jgi:hypothetical protein
LRRSSTSWRRSAHLDVDQRHVGLAVLCDRDRAVGVIGLADDVELAAKLG